MNTPALAENVSDLDHVRPEAGDKRRWWSFLRRADRPRRPSRREVLEEMQTEHRRLVETIDRLAEKLEGPADRRPAIELEPIPLFEGIRHLAKGQQEVSSTLKSLNQWVERSSETDTRLVSAVEKVDETLGEVRGSQEETVSALDQVGTRMEESSRKFETLFERMERSESELIEQYRLLQRRTILAVSGLGVAMAAVTALLAIAPWS